jgi:LmbE family N-acetylglucosaminyl deacetylase
VVFTHPYEGGHPDHDATAAAVHAAGRLAHEADISIVEFASYHAGPAGFECERFLDPQHGLLDTQPLGRQEREHKRAILACYGSQKAVLAQFPLEREPLRAAPDYNFSRPPHSGTLYYEHFDWGITGAQWRDLAEQAFRQLRLEPDLTPART